LKRLIVSLDKTLIHRLVSFKALWSCTETLFWTLSAKKFGPHLDLISKLSAKVFFFFKWTTPLKWHFKFLDHISFSTTIKFVLWSFCVVKDVWKDFSQMNRCNFF